MYIIERPIKSLIYQIDTAFRYKASRDENSAVAFDACQVRLTQLVTRQPSTVWQHSSYMFTSYFILQQGSYSHALGKIIKIFVMHYVVMQERIPVILDTLHAPKLCDYLLPTYLPLGQCPVRMYKIQSCVCVRVFRYVLKNIRRIQKLDWEYPIWMTYFSILHYFDLVFFQT